MKFIKNIDPSKHDEFIKNQPLSNLLQSSNWARVKENWTSDLVGLTDDKGKILVSSLLLTRILPLGYSMIYIPRGIAMDYENTELLGLFISELKKYGKSKKALFIKFDPTVRVGEDQRIQKNLGCLSVKYLGLSKDMHETIQPRFNAMVYAADFAEENLGKKARQFIRKARNSSSEVAFGGEELLADFSGLMKKTEMRKDINLRNEDYYRKILNIYGSEAYITLVRLNLGHLEEEAKASVEKLTEGLAKTHNEKRQKSLTDELGNAQKSLSALETLIKEYGRLVPVAGTLTIRFGGTAETIYAGTNTDFQRYYPSYLAWFETMQHAFTAGTKALNMGGLENTLSEKDGLLKFKKHFNPEIEEYIGEFDIPVNKALYPLAKKLYTMKKTGF